MAFVFTVEDGSGVVGANAYLSVVDADDYHAGRANPAWSSADLAAKQAAIVKATDHIELIFGERFIGQRASQEQGSPGRAWRRTTGAAACSRACRFRYGAHAPSTRSRRWPRSWCPTARPRS
jgi:hypothetical protein